MEKQQITLGACRVEVLTDGEKYIGIGKVWIDETLVRSGRLPITIFTQSYTGAEIDSLVFRWIEQTDESIRIMIGVIFRPMEVKPMRDHSFDPVYEQADWDSPCIAGTGDLTMVITPAADSFNGVEFNGLAYHYEYASTDIPIYHILEKASWELDGDIEGATIYNQSSCSDPVATVAADTFWSTEGYLFFLDEASYANRCMTHNLPRWASHQAFDFQGKGNKTLLGVYGRVELIRSLLTREAGKAEFKTFDKHIFDQTFSFATSPKSILLNCDPKTMVAQQNVWTWVYDIVHRRARAEFGLKEQPAVPTAAIHYWNLRSIDSYLVDVVPGTVNVGGRAIFMENFKKSDLTEGGNSFTPFNGGNFCISHEYEIAPFYQTEKIKAYTDYCRKLGIANYMWTNTYVSHSAKINSDERDNKGWFCALEDTRLKYGGAYSNWSSCIDLKHPDARKYYIEAHLKVAEETGLAGFYIDSFYNLFFMPVNFKRGYPTTMWREALEVLKTWQEAGLGIYIESFGPFGQPGHGHPASYNAQNIFACYYVGLGNGYTTIPVPGSISTENIKHDVAFIYYQCAHKVPPKLDLFVDGKRLDEFYGPEHRRVLDEYHNYLDRLYTRYLQEDGLSVIWHNETGNEATLWNFVDRQAALPGTVTDLTSGEELPAQAVYSLQATHTYAISVCPLPTEVITSGTAPVLG